MNSDDIFSEKKPSVKFTLQKSEGYEERRLKWALRKEQQEKFLSADMWRSCINCANFIETKEICMLNNMKPPAKIIVIACECHDFDIPF